MNPALFGLVIIASQFLVALALLFVAGSLIRIDLNRAEAADSRFAKIPSRFIRDLRALKDALVEFFARSNESCRILSVLVAHRKPLRLSAIAREVQRETDWRREPYVLPMSIAWAVLWLSGRIKNFEPAIRSSAPLLLPRRMLEDEEEALDMYCMITLC